MNTPASNTQKLLSWAEIDTKALTSNMLWLRSLVSERTIIAPCVKANAYGHGLIGTSEVLLENGANWLSVDKIEEAELLREGGITAPIYIMGYIPLASLRRVVSLDNTRIVVYNHETIEQLGPLAAESKRSIPLHIKIETGTGRQGVTKEGALKLAQHIAQFQYLELEGAATHFADLEDNETHTYAHKQLDTFLDTIRALERHGHHIKIRHCANAAATLVLPQARLDMIRPGIICYGMWPSEVIRNEYATKAHLQEDPLTPAFTWKSRIAQIKNIPLGAFIGYGCSYRALANMRIAVIPVGYYDGYDRALSNCGEVLIQGTRCPVVGRVCMNMFMVDISHLETVTLEEEVVLLGKQGTEIITSEEIADHTQSINYTVPTRITIGIGGNTPRIFV